MSANKIIRLFLGIFLYLLSFALLLFIFVPDPGKDVTPPDDTHYTVTFDTENGEPDKSVTVLAGQTVAKPDDPVRNGYEFLGWKTAKGEAWYEKITPVREDTRLIAQWKQVIYYRLTDEGAVITKYDSAVANIILPSTVDGHEIVGIGDNVFAGKETLRSITLPDGIRSLGKEVFKNCTGLEEVTLSDSLCYIGTDCFAGCSSLRYNNWNKCRYLGTRTNQHFLLVMGFDALGTSVNIASSAKIIASHAFKSFTKLSSVNLPSELRHIGAYAFYNCALTELSLPKEITRIENYTFYGCRIRSLTLPEGLTYIGEYAFYGMPLTAVVIPDSVTLIDKNAFANCSSLNSVTIRETSTLKEIEELAFSGNGAYVTFFIPASVEKIGPLAFSRTRITRLILDKESRLSTIGYSANYLSSIEILFFGGTAEDWIDIKGRDNISPSYLFYYSESKPYESGLFWHYNSLGDPVTW